MAQGWGQLHGPARDPARPCGDTHCPGQVPQMSPACSALHTSLIPEASEIIPALLPGSQALSSLVPLHLCPVIGPVPPCPSLPLAPCMDWYFLRPVYETL